MGFWSWLGIGIKDWIKTSGEFIIIVGGTLLVAVSITILFAWFDFSAIFLLLTLPFLILFEFYLIYRVELKSKKV